MAAVATDQWGWRFTMALRIEIRDRDLDCGERSGVEGTPM